MTEIVDINARRNLPAGANYAVSKPLEEALATKTTWTLEGEERTYWKAPSSVLPEMRDEAVALVRRIDTAMELAPQDRMRQWLLDLAPLVASNISVEDARTKLTAYVGMLEYPAACFTKTSLAKAGRKFTFYPAFKELCDFFDDLLRDLKIKRQRLDAIINSASGQRQIGPPPPVSVEERQRVGTLFGMLSKAIQSGDYDDVMTAANVRRQGAAE